MEIKYKQTLCEIEIKAFKTELVKDGEKPTKKNIKERINTLWSQAISDMVDDQLNGYGEAQKELDKLSKK